MVLARVAAALRPVVAMTARRPATAVSRMTVARFSGAAEVMPEAMEKKEAEAHAAWLKGLEALPIYEPDFYWTLEFALPPLMELHQFGESPVIVEVQNRDPEADPEDHH